MRRLVAAAVALALGIALAAASAAPPPEPDAGPAAVAAKRCGKGRALLRKGGRSRCVKRCPRGYAKKRRRGRAVCVRRRSGGQTPTTTEPETTPTPTTPESTTPTTTEPAPTGPAPDVTGQEAIDRMTQELKGGRWRYYTSGSQSSTEYILNLCEDGTFYRTGNGIAFVWGYGTWKVVDAAIKGDGSVRAAQVEGTKTDGDPPPDGSPYNWVVGARNDGSGDQWYVDDIAAFYEPGGAVCNP